MTCLNLLWHHLILRERSGFEVIENVAMIEPDCSIAPNIFCDQESVEHCWKGCIHHGSEDLIRVNYSNVPIVVHVAVETVMLRNLLVSHMTFKLSIQINVLKDIVIGLIPRQGEMDQLNITIPASNEWGKPFIYLPYEYKDFYGSVMLTARLLVLSCFGQTKGSTPMTGRKKLA